MRKKIDSVPVLRDKTVIWFVLFGLIVFLARLYLRTPLLELDEAEQAVFARTLAPGYPGQPPLYAWMQYALFQVGGLQLSSLALLKSLLLTTALSAWHGITGRFCADTRVRWCATLSWVLLPCISFDLLKDNTHSVLALGMAALTFYWFTAPAVRLRWYFSGALIISGGILSKFNYLLFLLPLIAGGLTIPEYRQRVLRPHFLITLFLTGVLVSPWGWWLITHPEAGLHSAWKLRQPQPGATKGLLTLVGAITTFLMAPLLAWILFRPLEHRARVDSPQSRLLTRYHVILIAGLFLLTPIFGVYHIQARWLIPLFFLTPLLIFRYVKPGARYLRGFAVTCLASFCLIQVALAVRSHWFPNQNAHFPLQQLLPILDCKRFPDRVLLSESHWFLGNMLVYCPKQTVICLRPYKQPEPVSGEGLLVWQTPELPTWISQAYFGNHRPVEVVFRENLRQSGGFTWVNRREQAAGAGG